MLPKHQQHRKHREQIGRKPTDEPGLDLEHARIASSKASHALTSSIGKAWLAMLPKAQGVLTMVVEDLSDKIEVIDLD